MATTRKWCKHDFEGMAVGGYLEFRSPRLAHSAFCAAKFYAARYAPEMRFKVKSERNAANGAKIHRLWRIA